MNQKKIKYFLFVKTGPVRYDVVDRAFDSYLEADKFFHENKEMWGTDKYKILSSTQIQKNIERSEKRKQQIKKVGKTTLNIAKKVAKRAYENIKESKPTVREKQFEEPTESIVRPSLAEVKHPTIVKPPEKRYSFNFNPNYKHKFKPVKPVKLQFSYYKPKLLKPEDLWQKKKRR